MSMAFGFRCLLFLGPDLRPQSSHVHSNLFPQPFSLFAFFTSEPLNK